MRASFLFLACAAAYGQSLDVTTGLQGMMDRYLGEIASRQWQARASRVAAIRTPDAVRERQAYIRKTLLEEIGGFPEKTPLNAKVTGTVERDAYTIEKIVFESRPGFLVTANLYLPKGDKKPRPRFRTRMKMLWDDQYLYIAAQLDEPHVWATLTERDSVIFRDNDFEVFLNPSKDTKNYYELEINALNTLWDLRLPKPYRDGGPPLNEWDVVGIKTAVHVNGTLNVLGGVVMGCVLQAGAGMNVARQAALEAGLPIEVPAETVNRVCGSGLQAVVHAVEAIHVGASSRVSG